MRRSKGASTYVATLVLVAISLSLSYVVYGAVSGLRPTEQVVFSNQETELGGPQSLLRVVVNASSASTPVALDVGGASSTTGVLDFDGTAYGTTPHLCLSNSTTFFAVYTENGVISADTNGRVWIDGYWTRSLSVQTGWQELMFSDASTCSVTLPGGETASYPGDDVSAVPIIGSTTSSTFLAYIPTTGSIANLVMVFNGSYDTIA